jgi:hypothetical protein
VQRRTIRAAANRDRHAGKRGGDDDVTGALLQRRADAEAPPAARRAGPRQQQRFRDERDREVLRRPVDRRIAADMKRPRDEQPHRSQRERNGAAVALASAPTNERLLRATLRRVPLDCTLDSTFKRHR